MARRQVLVQLDDELVAELDEVAKLRGENRSELIRQGALALLAAHREPIHEEALIDGYRQISQDARFVELAARLASDAGEGW